MGTPMTYISGNTGAYQSGTFNKGTIALNLNPTSLGSGNNWYNGVDVTATQYLIYSDTYSTGIATQANSKPTAWTTPDLSDTSLLNLINTLPDRIGLTPFTSLPLALQWLNATNEYFLIKTNFENIVTSGLVLNLDAGWYNSYSGTTTWFDIKGGYNGTLTNGPTFNGSSQGAIVFDGGDDYISFNNISPISSLTFTISSVVTVDTDTVQYMRVVSKGHYGFTPGYLLQRFGESGVATGIRFSLGIGSSTSNASTSLFAYTTDTFQKGQKYYLTMVSTGTYLYLYVNGVRVGLTKYSGTGGSIENGTDLNYSAISGSLSITTSDKFTIGAYSNTSSPVTEYWNGKISNTLIYNTALSPEQVLQNYNAQKSRFGIYDIVQSGLTLSYDASNYLSYPRSGSTWFDMTSNSGNGSLINGPTFNTGATPSIQFDGSDDTMRTNYNLSQFNTITINFLANSSYNNETMVWSLGSGGPDWYIKENTMGYNSYNSDTYGLSTTQVSQLGLRNNWHMLTMTYTQNGAIANNKVYVDGIRQTISQQLSTTRSMSFSNIGINFLSAFNNEGYSLNASVGHISVYNRELSAQEIVQNFESLRKQYPVTGYTTSGLTLNLDAGNYASYPTTGTKWVDISGNYNNGQILNGASWSSDNGGTFSFDGTDDYINCGTNIRPLLNGNIGITFEGWYNLSNVTTDDGLFAIRKTSDGDWYWNIRPGGSLFWVGYSTSSTSNYRQMNNPFSNSANTWVHIATTFTSGALITYINGVSFDNANISGTVNITADSVLSIGSYSVPGTYTTQGKISTFKIYNRALSASEILQNYNALKRRFGL